MNILLLLSGAGASDQAFPLSAWLCAAGLSGPADALILGGDDTISLPESVNAAFRLPAPPLSRLADPGILCPAISQWISQRNYDLILLTAGTNHNILAASLAFLLQGCCLCDLVDLHASESGSLCAVRGVCSLEQNAQFSIDRFPSVLTLFPPAQIPAVPSRFQHPSPLPSLRLPEQEIHISAFHPAEHLSVLAGADVVFIAGRGMGTQTAMDKLHRLAGRMGAQMGATRPVVFSGLAPLSSLVGISAATIAPRFCLVLGASGSAALLAGLTGSQTICAVNTDRGAPIFSQCDYALQADCNALLDALLTLTEQEDS